MSLTISLCRLLIKSTLLGMTTMSVHAQTASVVTQSASIKLNTSISAQKSAGRGAVLLLTVTNVGKQPVSISQRRVHVEGQDGEPPTTLFQRQLTHRLMPGEAPLRDDDMAGGLVPGASTTLQFELSKLYDLSKPGDYTVYVDLLDERESAHNAGVWVRSPTVHFHIPVQ